MEPSEEAPQEIPQHIQTSAEGPKLLVDFSWRKFKCLVKDINSPDSNALYIISYSAIKPQLKFKTASNNVVFGTGTLHSFFIKADYQVRGQIGTLVPQSRFKTIYTHQSRVFSDTDQPATMTWTSDSSFTKWDFVCVDERQMPVAKFTANIWAMKKVGYMEFLGPKANDPAAWEELLVVGITLFYEMALRINNIFNLVGACFTTPGQPGKEQRTVGGGGGGQDQTQA